MPQTIRKTIKKAVILCLFALALAVPLRAGEAAIPPLPKQLSVHVSLKSFTGFLKDADEFSVAVTKGSRVNMMPGMLPMLAQLYMPLPGEAWDPDGEVHLFIPAPELTLPPSRHHAIGVTTAGYDAFIKAIEEGGVENRQDEEYNCRIIELRDIGEYLAADGGGGLVVLASSPEMLDVCREAMAEGWKPRHWGEGILNLDSNIPDDWAETLELGDKLTEKLDELREQFQSDETVENLKKNGVDPDTLVRIVDAAGELFDWGLSEIKQVKGIAADLSLDGKRASLSLHVAAAAGMIAEAGANGGKLVNAENPAAAFIEKGPLAAIVAAPDFKAVFPDSWEKHVKRMADIFGVAFPAQKDALADRLAEQVRLCESGNVGATYNDNGRNYSVTWMKTSDAARFSAVYASLIEDFNAAIKTALPSADFAMRFSAAKASTPDGIPYETWTCVPDKPERFEEFLDGFSRDEEEIAAMLTSLRDFAIMLAAKNGYVLLVTGEAGEAELAAALKAMDGVAAPLVDQPEAKKAMEALRHRQFATAFLDAYQLSLAVADSMAASFSGDDGEFRRVLREALGNVRPKLRNRDELIGYASGAAGGRLVFDITVTADGITDIRHNYELLSDAVEKAAAEYFNSMADDETGDGDADENWDDDGNEEEDVIIETDDEPIAVTEDGRQVKDK